MPLPPIVPAANVEAEEEEEWIEAPGGWQENKSNDIAKEAKQATTLRGTNTANEDDSDSDDDGGFGMDFFANHNPRDTFRFDLQLVSASTTSDSGGENELRKSPPSHESHESDDTVHTNTKGSSIQINLKGYKLDSDETAQSTGVTLWQAAPRLATFLMTKMQHQAESLPNNTSIDTIPLDCYCHAPTSLSGRKVLELGAGLGLCGIVAHHLGARQVVLTDGDIHALKQLRENVQENNLGTTPTNKNTECRQLLWGKSAHLESFQSTYGRFDIILGADVIYTKTSIDPLFETVVELLARNGDETKERISTDADSTTSGSWFILSRYNKWSNVLDETVVEAGKTHGLDCTRPEEGIFIFSLMK